MSTPGPWITLDGHEAAASIAFRLSEIVAVHPNSSSSPMGELAEAWAARRQANVWGAVPVVTDMPNEGGAAGALHGALQAGALATSFTASHGLLLMIPNMFRIAGQLLPCVLHVPARAVPTHAQPAFGDHSDVMAVRSTGWALLCAGSVQEVQDMAAVAHAASLEARVPFLHFFDGFRTAHEVARIRSLQDADLRALVDEGTIARLRDRALSPDHPAMRGSTQNADVFFQSREAVNPFYMNTPGIVERTMRRFGALTGRAYRLFDYEGAPDAERVIVVMGSAAETVAEAVAALNAQGERVGVVKVRLFRPFSAAHFVRALPPSVRHIAVLDRSKEPGALGEPLYGDIVLAIHEAIDAAEAPFRFFPRVIGGRYGLGAKEFTATMAAAVFDELDEPSPRAHFTVGIHDDVSFASLAYDHELSSEDPETTCALLYGVGSDGAAATARRSIEIIAEETALHVQGYFVGEASTPGSTTTSHLRFGPRPIRSSYLIAQADLVACEDWELLERVDVLDRAAEGATFLVNSPYPPHETWRELPLRVQQRIVERKLRLFVVDAARIALETGAGKDVNGVLQTCFFALAKALPAERAIAAVRRAVRDAYAARGEETLQAHLAAVDAAPAGLAEVEVPLHVAAGAVAGGTATADSRPVVRTLIAPMTEGRGDLIPVSALPADGTFPVGTSRWQTHRTAEFIPVWTAATCIQCNKCAIVCPHAAIHVKAYDAERLASAPPTFKSIEYRGTGFDLDGAPESTSKYTVQVTPDDCTGCELCVEVCQARDKATGEKALVMSARRPLGDAERQNFEFFLGLPQVDRAAVNHGTVEGSQFLQPLFGYSGACPGCGETPYLKLVTQLFGDRIVVANAIGCSSAFAGSVPANPWSCNDEGRGPAWAGSLVEDDAEFGYGIRLAIDAHAEHARALLREVEPVVGTTLCSDILESRQADETEIYDQRLRVAMVKRRLHAWLDMAAEPASHLVADAWRLLGLADYLVKKSVWIVGGDEWAYDGGYAGLDRILAAHRDVNVLVLDTDGSASGRRAFDSARLRPGPKFAASGRRAGKKDLALLAMTYGHVYVANVALGADDTQTVRALLEADSYDGPSLIVARAHCPAHGGDMKGGLRQQGLAVRSGDWPLLRFDPRARDSGRFPLTLDSEPARISMDFARQDTRLDAVAADSVAAARLREEAQHDINARWQLYAHLAGMRTK